MTKPLLHLVFGGEVADPRGTDYLDVRGLDLVGIYPNYAEAFKAWRAASQRHVDQANIKYVIVHLHRLFDPAEMHGQAPIEDESRLSRGLPICRPLPRRARGRGSVRAARLPLRYRAEDAREHGFEHRGREPAGVGVLPRAVIAVGEQQPAVQPMQSRVREREAGTRQLEGVEDGVVRHLTQSDDRLQSGEAGDLLA